MCLAWKAKLLKTEHGDGQFTVISLALMFAATFLVVLSTPLLEFKMEMQNWLILLLCSSFAAVGIVGLISALKKKLFR